MSRHTIRSVHPPLKFQDFLNSINIKSYIKTAPNLESLKQQSPCPIGPANGCGTCPLSEYPYPIQVRLKTAYIQYLLDYIHTNTSSHVLKNKTRMHNIETIKSPSPSHYRNKMEYTIGFNGNIGLREKGKWWKILHKHTCFLALPKIESLFYKLVDIIPTLDLPYYDRKRHTGLLRLLTIRTTNTGQTALRLTISNPNMPQYKSPYTYDEIKKRIIAKFSRLNIDSLYLQLSDRIADVSHGKSILVWGEEYIYETFKLYQKHIQFAVTPDTFFQINQFMASKYLELVAKWFQSVTKHKNLPITIYDLYGGIGFFGLTLLKLFPQKIRKVVIVEENPYSINAGHHSMELMQLPKEKIDFINAKVEDVIPDIPTSRYIGIIDPARSGLHPRVIKILQKNPPEKMLYISCNPLRFAQEFVNFELFNYFDLSPKVVLLDNFPQTNHLETFLYLDAL